MLLFFVFLYSFATILTPTWTSEQDLKLVVNPSGHVYGAGPPVLIRKVEDSLNLTCRLINHRQEMLQNYNITWKWQHRTGGNANRVIVVSMSHNEANMVFQSLKEDDSGEYTCKCPEFNLTEYIRVKVKAFKKFCNEKMFGCSPGNCIRMHYVCDGKQDCKDGMDESKSNCGPNPCEGKIPCEDGRCIPTSWCCDEDHDPNCTVKIKPKCCQQLLKPYQDQDPVFSEQHFSDMGFLQTTIYTVIGCAMAFMFIVTILVIAICRVHIKRTIVSRCPLNHQHLHPGSPLRPPLPLYDIDMFLDRHTESTHPGLLVTYNINNGVHFVGRPIDPPPYCEVVDTPPREGPPPPYISRENLTVIPLSQNEDNSVISRDSAIHELDADSQSDIIRLVTYIPENTVTPVASNEVMSDENAVCECGNEIIDFKTAVNTSAAQEGNLVEDGCCSSPSVSGLNSNDKKDNNNTVIIVQQTVYNDLSDDSESDSMENDALLNEATIERKDSSVSNRDCEDCVKVTRSSSFNANLSASPSSFINNITAVSKTLIGSLKRQTDVDLKSKLNRQLITQKSFDSSDQCEIKLTNSENSNFNNKVTHSVGDLSPVNADFERLDFLTLPLRESFIGVRNEEI